MADKFSSLGTKYFGRDGPISITWLYFFLCNIPVQRNVSYVGRFQAKLRDIDFSTVRKYQSLRSIYNRPNRYAKSSRIDCDFGCGDKNLLPALACPLSRSTNEHVPCKCSYYHSTKKKKEKCSYYQYRKPRTLSSAQFLRHMYGE